MTHLIKLFLIALLFSTSVICDEENPNSEVLELTDETITEAIANNKNIFIEFYAPWCGHCKRLAPDYEIVASFFKDSDVVIAKIDASTHNQAAGTYEVRGFPTLKLFVNGQPTDYEGERGSMAMIQWIKKKTGPATKHITTAEESTLFFAEPVIRVVTYVAPDSDNFQAWQNVANARKLEDFELAHVTDESLFNGQSKDTVVIFRFEEEPIVYNAQYDADLITAWVLSEAYPLIDELGPKIWTRSVNSKTPLLAIFVKEVNEETFTLTKAVAKPFKGRVLTSYSASQQLAERWGASGKVIPTAIYVKWVNDEPKMVIYNEDGAAFDAESGVNFVNEALAGTYQGYKKSEAIPASNDDAVKVIVGKTFEEIVYDKEKDVFVEFYAPWCGHCKKLAPVWDELGEIFEDKAPHIVIAKIDATANSYPETIDVKGFPTLIFFPADNKQGITYNEERDLDSLKDFIVEHASRPITNKEDL
jgi:protein disulfide-isomerase A1